MNESAADAAREILLAAIRAADPRALAATALRGWREQHAGASIDVIAVGKAADAMVRGAAEALGDVMRGGVVIAPAVAPSLAAGLRAFAGGHPTPNGEGARGAEEVMRLLGAAGRTAPVLALISGGASSLMTLPAPGLTLDDIVAVSRALMAAGADIRELNCVRKHLDQLKGGLMARAAGGTTIRALVLSDVIGDPLDVIASGPLVADPTTYHDAIGVLRSRGTWEAVPRAVADHLLAGARGEIAETPKAGDACFAHVEIEVIGNNALAVRGAADEARRRGFDVETIGEAIAGEARQAGEQFARRAMQPASTAARPRCIVAGGETTVTVAGTGVGGRNLEFAAAAALTIDGVRGIAVGSIGTDGRDGPTDAAGAVVDGDTVPRARRAGVDIAGHLRNNDTLRALDAAAAVMRTGLTGTNVMDVAVATIIPG